RCRNAPPPGCDPFTRKKHFWESPVSAPRKPHRNVREALHHYGSIILAGVGIAISLAVVILRPSGRAEEFKGFVEHLLLPIGVFILSALYLLTLYGQREIAEEVRQLTDSLNDPSSERWKQRVTEALPVRLREVFASELDAFFDGLRLAVD